MPLRASDPHAASLTTVDVLCIRTRWISLHSLNLLNLLQHRELLNPFISCLRSLHSSTTCLSFLNTSLPNSLFLYTANIRLRRAFFPIPIQHPLRKHINVRISLPIYFPTVCHYTTEADPSHRHAPSGRFIPYSDPRSDHQSCFRSDSPRNTPRSRTPSRTTSFLCLRSLFHTSSHPGPPWCSASMREQSRGGSIIDSCPGPSNPSCILLA